jgi:hypothetical protein
LTLYAPGQVQPNRIRLRTHGGAGELILKIVQQYNLIFLPDVVQRLPFDVLSSYYLYRILDRNEQEIVVYHWEPDGRSHIVKPHLHMPAAAPVTLAQAYGSRIADQKTHLGKLHLPTGRIGIEEIVELLIVDFIVDPIFPNWKEILDEIRAPGSQR